MDGVCEAGTEMFLPLMGVLNLLGTSSLTDGDVTILGVVDPLTFSLYSELFALMDRFFRTKSVWMRRLSF